MTVQTLAILKPSLMGVAVKPPHQNFSHIFTLLAELLPQFSKTLSGTVDEEGGFAGFKANNSAMAI